MSHFPRFFGFSDAELYMKNTTPIRGSGLIPLRHDRRNSHTYRMHWVGRDIAARMYHEDIVVWRPDGSILVSDYNSRTTQDVQNELLPSRLWVSAQGGHKHLNSYAFVGGYMVIRRNEVNMNWEPTYDSHGYCYGPGRKFFSPRMREYYLALRAYLNTVYVLNPDSLDNIYGSYSPGNAQETYEEFSKLLDKHSWHKGQPLHPELIEAGVNTRMFGKVADRLSHFKCLKYEYKGPTLENKEWSCVNHKEHSTLQAFLDSFKN